MGINTETFGYIQFPFVKTVCHTPPLQQYITLLVKNINIRTSHQLYERKSMQLQIIINPNVMVINVTRDDTGNCLEAGDESSHVQSYDSNG